MQPHLGLTGVGVELVGRLQGIFGEGQKVGGRKRAGGLASGDLAITGNAFSLIMQFSNLP